MQYLKVVLRVVACIVSRLDCVFLTEPSMLLQVINLIACLQHIFLSFVCVCISVSKQKKNLDL